MTEQRDREQHEAWKANTFAGQRMALREAIWAFGRAMAVALKFERIIRQLDRALKKAGKIRWRREPEPEEMRWTETPKICHHCHVVWGHIDQDGQARCWTCGRWAPTYPSLPKPKQMKLPKGERHGIDPDNLDSSRSSRSPDRQE